MSKAGLSPSRRRSALSDFDLIGAGEWWILLTFEGASSYRRHSGDDEMECAERVLTMLIAPWNEAGIDGLKGMSADEINLTFSSGRDSSADRDNT